MNLVLVSAVYPSESYANGKADHTMLLSNDESFCNSFKNNTEVDANFDNHSLEKPLVQYIRSIQNSSNGLLNLIKDDEQNVREGLTQKILDIIQEKNERYYLGKTFIPKSDQFPSDAICFNLTPDKRITNNKLYVTIVSERLNFVYSIKHPVDFWHNKASISSEFQSSEGDSNISFKVTIDEEDERDIILTQLKSPDNLVFIHPDSNVSG